MVQAIRSIHKAGVLHRDIRPDNLLIDAEGTKTTVIDFDRATFDPSVHDKHMERKEVEELVNGRYTGNEGEHYETPASYVPSPSPASIGSTQKRSSSSLSDLSDTSTERGRASSASDT